MNIHRQPLVYAASLAAAFLFGLLIQIPMRDEAKADAGMDRAQTIILGLNKMQGCAGWFLLKDLRDTKTMDHDLTKARRQIEEADHTYARLRGRPDSKFMETVLVKLAKTEQTRLQLEQDLQDTFDQLRSSIKETLITDEERKKKH